MTGMGTASVNGAGLAGPFYHRLLVQALVLLLLGLVLIATRYFLLQATTTAGRVRIAGSSDEEGDAVMSEPQARLVLRWGFGLIWILDGLLQMQRAMPTSLTSQVIVPASQGSPHWLVSLVQVGIDLWERHPLWAATGAVWIQLAIGIWLLVGRSGWFARLGYAAAVAWGLVVWVGGESMGGILAPGASWLFGAPGAVLFYVLAAVALFFPESAWRADRLPRWLLGILGLNLLVFGVLEAWPGRGFYHGQIPSMISSMAQTPQPALLSRPMVAVANLLAHHQALTAAVNVVVSVVLVGVGIAFLMRRFLWPAWGALAVLSLLTWWFLQDFGFLGGVGTDPNSMMPELLVAFTGVWATTHAVVPADAPEGFWPSSLGFAGRLFGVWTVVTWLLGVGPLAYAAMNQTASPALALATSDTPFTVDRPLPSFTLLDQHGVQVSIRQFAGKRIVLTNLDPVCTLDCPLIAQELRSADLALPPSTRAKTVFVAVAANPVIHSVRALQIFDATENLSGLSNWYYLTSPSLATLSHVWEELGFGVTQPVDGVMVEHEDLGYVIGPHLTERYIVPMNPSQYSPLSQSISSLYAHLVGEV